MAKKHAGPWLRKSDLNWYTTVNGKLVKLGTAQDEPEGIHRAYLAAHGASRLTVGELIDKFLAAAKIECSPGTHEWYSGYLLTFKATAGSLAAVDVTPTIVTAWIKAKYGNCAASTLNSAARTITRVYNWAEDENLISKTPLRKLRKAKPGRREYFVTPQQYTLCLRHCDSDRLRDVIKFLWHTGCRPQELRAIEAKWVVAKRITFPYPVKNSRRVIFLDSMAYAIVDRLSQKHPTGPIFQHTKCAPWSSTGLQNAFRRLRIATSLTGLCAYSFRHAFITRLLERNVDVATVAAISGNSPQMVLDYYSHVGTNEERLHNIVRLGNAVA